MKKRMSNIISLVVLVCGLFIAPNYGFTLNIQSADVFLTPQSNDFLGGFLGGSGSSEIDWSIANSCPFGSKTDDMVFSTCVGYYMNASDWKERMRITNEGNVGIANTNPTEKLEISGNIKLSPGDNRDFFVGARTTGEYHSGYDLTISAGSAGGYFGGIGASKGGDLYLKGGVAGGFTGAKGGDIHILAGNAAGAMGVADGGKVYISGGAPVFTGKDGDIILAHNGTDSFGNVGIGTISPSTKLEVFSLIEQEDGDLVKFNSGIWNNRSIKAGIEQGQAYIGGFDEQGSSPRSLILQPYGHNVGIGITSPTYTLHVSGDIAYTGNIYDVSDIRLKENIISLDNALEKISLIHGIYFNNIGESSGKREVGVIAQDVETVLPEVVSEDVEGYKSVDYSKLTPLLIEAVKELKAKNEHLRIQNEKLRARDEEISALAGDLLSRIEVLERKN